MESFRKMLYKEFPMNITKGLNLNYINNTCNQIIHLLDHIMFKYVSVTAIRKLLCHIKNTTAGLAGLHTGVAMTGARAESCTE